MKQHENEQTIKQITSISKENTIFAKLDKELHDKVSSSGLNKFGGIGLVFHSERNAFMNQILSLKKTQENFAKNSQTLQKLEFAFENGKVKKTVSIGLNLDELKSDTIKLPSLKIKF